MQAAGAHCSEYFHSRNNSSLNGAYRGWHDFRAESHQGHDLQPIQCKRDGVSGLNGLRDTPPCNSEFLGIFGTHAQALIRFLFSLDLQCVVGVKINICIVTLLANEFFGQSQGY
jgi:hypothetical protein